MYLKNTVHKKNPKVILIQEQTSDHDFLENESKNSLKLHTFTCLKNAFRLLFQRKRKNRNDENISLVDLRLKTTTF